MDYDWMWQCRIRIRVGIFTKDKCQNAFCFRYIFNAGSTISNCPHVGLSWVYWDGSSLVDDPNMKVECLQQQSKFETIWHIWEHFSKAVVEIHPQLHLAPAQTGTIQVKVLEHWSHTPVLMLGLSPEWSVMQRLWHGYLLHCQIARGLIVWKQLMIFI